MQEANATGTRIRGVAWTKDDPVGAEFAVVELDASRLRARGIAIGSDPEPYQLAFELSTGDRFIPERCVVDTRAGSWRRRVEIDRSAQGVWSVAVEADGDTSMPDPGGDLSQLQSALDLDLGLSPVFNTMPVLRHDLHAGGQAEDFLMIWISVPDLSLHASPQRYTFLERVSEEERTVRFEAVGEGEDFTADLLYDGDGLVVDYPGIARRIRTGQA